MGNQNADPLSALACFFARPEDYARRFVLNHSGEVNQIVRASIQFLSQQTNIIIGSPNHSVCVSNRFRSSLQELIRFLNCLGQRLP